jgi:peptide deformylase
MDTAVRLVTRFDRELRRLVRNLTQTMDRHEGVGLAAPQIGVGLRVFTFSNTLVPNGGPQPSRQSAAAARGSRPAGRPGGVPVPSTPSATRTS